MNTIVVIAFVSSTIVLQVECDLVAISNQDIRVRTSLAKCIANASEVYFNEHEIITISLGPNMSLTQYSLSLSLDAMLLPELFTKEKWSLLLKQPHKGRPMLARNYLNYHPSDSYVLQLRSWQEINMHLVYLRKQPSWNPHAKFVVISATLYDNVERIIEYLIKRLWAHDILNGVILFPDEQIYDLFNIYTWFPFADGSCGDQFNRIEKIGSCSYGIMQQQNNWFPEKLPGKMNNCSVRVRTFDYPPFVIKENQIGRTKRYNLTRGLEIEMLNLLSQVANLFMVYEVSNDDEKWGNFQWPLNTSTGIVGALVRQEADVGVAAMSATPARNRHLDSTSAYFQDSIGFCVPHAKEQSQWQKFADIMTLEIWLAVILTIIIITLLTSNLSRFNQNEKIIYQNYGSVAQKVLGITVGHAMNIQPTSTQIRLFLMLWIIFSLHLDTAYQTYLMSTLTKIEYAYQIKNIDDILATDLDLLLLPMTVGYFSSDDKGRGSKQTRQIAERWKHCDDVDDCLRRTAYKRDSVIAASRLYIQYAKSSYISKTGLPLLYCLEERIVSFPIVAYMRRGYPLQHKFEAMVNVMNNAGFLERYSRELFNEKKFAGGFRNESYDEDDFLDVERVSLITLEHMRPIFWLLMVGYANCIFVFFIELVVCKMWKRFHH